MRTSNIKVKNKIVSVYFLLFIFVVYLVVVFNVFTDFGNIASHTFLLLVFGVAFLFFLIYIISKYFEYNSDGLNLILINRGFILSEYFNYREHVVEFEKTNLVAFKFQNYIAYQRLVLYYKTKNGNKIKSCFNVTLLAKKKQNYISQSLKKILKNNLQNN